MQPAGKSRIIVS